MREVEGGELDLREGEWGESGRGSCVMGVGEGNR